MLIYRLPQLLTIILVLISRSMIYVSETFCRRLYRSLSSDDWYMPLNRTL